MPLPPASLTASAGFEILTGFRHGDSVYYLLNNAAGVTRAEAEAEAARFGGALASIETQAENDAIFAAIDQYDAAWAVASGSRHMGPWIGASRDASGAFAWESGADFTFAAWASGEPNNYGGGEDHVHYLAKTIFGRAPTWNDLAADGVWPVLFSSTRITSLVVEFDAPAPVIPKTTAQIFAERGQLGFMAQLATAAYALGPHDGPARALRNNESATGDAARDGGQKLPGGDRLAALETQIRWLDSFDLGPALARADAAPANVDYPEFGLQDGLYVNLNAAALVGRSEDALFLAFRGTNDNRGVDINADTALLNPPTPDMDHWFPMGDHFDLFTPLIDAVKAYADNPVHGITDIYVTGHSLGAGMVEALTSDWSDPRLSAVAFANPGFGVIPDPGGEDRQINFLVDGDSIFWPSLLQDNDGDANRIYHNLLSDGLIANSGTLHSMQLYADFIHFLESEGLGIAAFENLRGIDYDRISIHVGKVDENALEFDIGGGRNIISGTTRIALDPDARDDVDDIILGGKGNDRLIGLDGHDYLVGGTGRDRIEGGGGRDYLIGGAGRDTMIGGGGTDFFVFRSTSDSGAARLRQSDLIRNFDKLLLGQDSIDLAAIDADATRPGDQSFVWIDTAAFSGVAGQLRQESVRKFTVVQGDTDGDGMRDFQVRLTGTVTLDSGDFVL